MSNPAPAKGVGLSSQLKFSREGLKLDLTVTGVSSSMTNFSPALAKVDVAKLQELADLLAHADFSSVESVIKSIEDLLRKLLEAFPTPANLLASLESLLNALGIKVEDAASRALKDLEAAIRYIVDALRDISLEVDGIDLGVLADILSFIDRALARPEVRALLGLVTPWLPRLGLDKLWAAIGRDGQGVVVLGTMMGALLAEDWLSRQFETASWDVHTSFEPWQLEETLTQVGQWAAGNDLAQKLAKIDPNDQGAVDAITASVIELASTVSAVSDALANGFNATASALDNAELARLGPELELVSALLIGADPAPVKLLADDLAKWSAPLLRLQLPSVADVNAAGDEVKHWVERIATLISGLDPAAVARPVTAVLGDLPGALGELAKDVEKLSSAARAILAQVHHAVAATDLAPLAASIRRVLEPVVPALAAIGKFVDEAQQEIKTAIGDFTQALNTVRTDVTRQIKTVSDGVTKIIDTVAQSGLHDVAAHIHEATEAVASALRAVPFQPVIDVAIGIMNTAAQLLAAIPRALLPEAARNELEAACERIQNIDFTEVAGQLRQELDAVVKAAEDDALAGIDEAFKTLVGYLSDAEAGLKSVITNPDLEKAFTAFADKVRSADPAALLEPVEAVLRPIRQAISSIDPAALLKALDDVFDTVKSGVAALDPDKLLAPVVAQITALHDEIEGSLQLSHWGGFITKAETAVTAVIGLLDPAAIASRLDRIFDEIAAGLLSLYGVSWTDSLAVRLLQATGLDVHPDSLANVLDWMKDGGGAKVVAGRLSDTVHSLGTLLTDVESIDLRAQVGPLEVLYVHVAAALAGHPDGSLARQRLDGLLGQSVTDLLLFATTQQKSLTSSLEGLLATVRVLAASDRSEVTSAVHGLREALAPLDQLVAWVKGLAAWLGADVNGRSLRPVLADLFAKVRPSQLLAPLVPAAADLRAKLTKVVHDGVAVPLTAVAGDLSHLVNAIDIAPLAHELHAIFAQVLAEVDALRPSKLFGTIFDELGKTLTEIGSFDPLKDVREAIKALEALAATMIEELRPSTLVAPILVSFDHLILEVSALNVRALLEPVLEALGGIQKELDDGLDDAGTTLEKLKAACHGEGAPLVAVKVAS